MSTQQLYLAAYDISDDKQRAFARYRLKAYSRFAQLSSFECWLTKEDKQDILQILESSVQRTISEQPSLLSTLSTDAYCIIKIASTYWLNASKANRLIANTSASNADSNMIYIY